MLQAGIAGPSMKMEASVGTQQMQKISANLSAEVVDAIEEIARRRGVTKTEVLRHALATEKFIDDQQRNGARILIEDPDSNELREVVFR